MPSQKNKAILILALSAIAIFLLPNHSRLPTILSLIGLTFCIIAITSMKLLRKLKKIGVRCPGRIVQKDKDKEGDTIITVEFSPNPSLTIREKPFTHSSTSWDKIKNSKETNPEVTVIYDPDNPKKFVLAEVNDAFAYPIFLVLGLLAVGVGIAALLGYIHIG